MSRISATEGTEAQRTVVLRGANVEVINTETNASLGQFKSLFARPRSRRWARRRRRSTSSASRISPLGAEGTKRVQLLAKITPFGALGGSGDNIDGVTFQYPVTVCDGCVAQVLGTCPLPSTTVIPADMANGCNVYQDGVVHCCVGPTGLVCPPTTVEQFMLTIAKTGANAATATVTSNPAGINCDTANTACTATFNSGTSVLLTASGGATITWTGATGCTTGTTCTTTMTASKTVTVSIAP